MVCWVCGDAGCWDGGDGGGGAGNTGGATDYLVVVVILVFGGHGEKGCFTGVDGFAPEFEVPVDEGAVVFVHNCVFDYYGPGTDTGFAPELCQCFPSGEGGNTDQCTTDINVQST